MSFVSDELNLELINSANTTRALIYNRVSKCGSTTMLSLIRKLSGRNGFHHAHSTIYNKRYISSGAQKQLATSVMKLRKLDKPFLFDRHLHMLNFTSFGFSQPIHINVVRDPVAQFVSGYYYQWSKSRSKSAKRQASIKGLVSWISASADPYTAQLVCTFICMTAIKPHKS